MTTPVYTSVPEHVRANLRFMLPRVKDRKLKGMICPAGGFTETLLGEDLFGAVEIVGLLDNDPSKHETMVSGIPVRAISSIETDRPDFIIVASMSYSREILAQLAPFSRRHRIRLLDICRGEAPTSFTYLNTTLAPIPDEVLLNARKYFPRLVSGRKRVVLYATDSLALNLSMRGMLVDLQIVGLIDGDHQYAGGECQGLRIISRDQAKNINADTIVMIDPLRRSESVKNVCAIATSQGLEIIDLCEGMTIDKARSQFADAIGGKILSDQMNNRSSSKVEIRVPNGGLCDSLCAISAAREFARRNPNHEVRFQQYPEILEAYGDGLVMPGRGGYVIPDQAGHFISDRWSSTAGNYQGCYYLGLGMNFDMLPHPELPHASPIEGLLPRSYIVLQTGVEATAPNPSIGLIEAIVRNAPYRVLCIGDGKKGRAINGVDYFSPASVLEMLTLIENAAAVLTSRAGISHVAAAYCVPSVIWTPGDAYDWHLNYSDWNHRRICLGDEGSMLQFEKSIEMLVNARQLPIASQNWLPGNAGMMPPLQSTGAFPVR